MIRRLLIGLASLLLSWLATALALAAPAVPSSAAHVYHYDGHHAVALRTYTTTERGRPATHNQAAASFGAADHWSDGASARPDGSTPPPAFAYDHSDLLAQVAGTSAATEEQARVLADDLSSLLGTSSAANAGRSRAFQFGNLPPGVLGSTDEFGNITIQHGLTGKVFNETLRHETVHSVLTPPAPLNKLTVGLYNKSGLYRYAEEALAEGYALRSVRVGLAFPLRQGYVSGVRLGLEGGGVAAGVGGLAYGWSQ